MTYEEVIKRAENLGSGLLSMGLSPGVHTMVGVYARNCPEWVITEQVQFLDAIAIYPEISLTFNKKSVTIVQKDTGQHV